MQYGAIQCNAISCTRSNRQDIQYSAIPNDAISCTRSNRQDIQYSAIPNDAISCTHRNGQNFSTVQDIAVKYPQPSEYTAASTVQCNAM